MTEVATEPDATAIETSPMPLPTRPWVAIVGNPYAGRRSNREWVDRLIRTLDAEGLPAVVVWDRAERREMLADPRVPHWCCCIVVAGGDGTVGDVINEMPDIPLAVMPLGNENLLAKEFGFTAGPDAIAQAILRGQHRHVDVGCVDGRRFSLMLSAGFDAEVVRRVAAWRAAGPAGKLRRVRHLSYVRPFFGALAGYHHGRVELEADGETHVGTHAIVFNVPRYGLNLPFVPHANASDGILDYIIFEKPGALPLVGYLARVCMRRACGAGIRVGKAKRIVIRSDQPVPIQIDGDAAGTTPVTVEAVPDAVRILRA